MAKITVKKTSGGYVAYVKGAWLAGARVFGDFRTEAYSDRETAYKAAQWDIQALSKDVPGSRPRSNPRGRKSNGGTSKAVVSRHGERGVRYHQISHGNKEHSERTARKLRVIGYRVVVRAIKGGGYGVFIANGDGSEITWSKGPYGDTWHGNHGNR